MDKDGFGEDFPAYEEGFNAGKEEGWRSALEALGLDYNAFRESNSRQIPDHATQNERILKFLQGGGKLTPKDALMLFGSFRLSARIFELREAGWSISQTMVRVGNRTWVAQFFMPDPKAPRGTPRAEARQMALSLDLQ